MRFELFHPCAALTPYIASFVIAESEATLPYAVLPDTSLVMGFQYKGRLAAVSGTGAQQPLSTIGITGLHMECRHFQNLLPTGTVLVRFKPGGAAAFFRQPVNELFGQSLSLDLFTPPAAIRFVEEQLGEAHSDAARIKVIESFLMSCKMSRPQDALVLEAVRLIERSAGVIPIAQVAKSLYTSASPLEKRFRSCIGTSPKKYAQIVRFQSILTAGNPRQGAAARAYEAGYFDQAHFIKDFRRFSGQTPEAFFTGKQP
ncbi:MAG: helix-turn-helix transcriptional regulator [Williamsia sp.]|nr:helix-turn-helix transcriptional regulator [Williamsia sp.]